MKTPSDHITVHFPMTGRTLRNSSHVWRRARPSRAMAYVVLLFFTSTPDSLVHDTARRWLRQFWSSARLNWQATMAAMFGVSWIRQQDERVLALRAASERDCPAIEDSHDRFIVPFILAMIGQVPLRGLLELIRENRGQWDSDRSDILRLPGAVDFCRDIDCILEGRSDDVSWARSSENLHDRSHVSGINHRQMRSLRAGDSVLLDPLSRGLSLRELERRCQAIALRESDDRHLYSVSTVEMPETGKLCVAIHRRS